MIDPSSIDAAAVDPPPTQPNRLRAALLAGAVLAAAVIGLADAEPASAHDELLAASPADGQVLEAAPAVIELEFSNDIIEMGSAIVVVDAAGERLAVGEPVIAGRTVTATLPADVTDGEYQVRWRVVSADGHPIEGTVDFGVGAGATGEYPAATSSDEASEPPADAEPADAEDDSAPFETWPIVAGVAGGLAVIAIAATLIIRTVRRRGDAS